jgi:hypothetical protein
VPVKPQDSELSSICVFRVIDFGSVPTSVEFDGGTVCVSNLCLTPTRGANKLIFNEMTMRFALY